jgi:hypothetical protein
MKSFTKIAVLALTILCVRTSFAGGAQPGPEIKYTDLVHCRPTDPNETQIRELIYFMRSETQWSNVNTPGIFLDMDNFDISLYGSNKNIHNVVDTHSNPESAEGIVGSFYAMGGNVRAFKIDAQGSTIKLSLVAGATGTIKVNQLILNCLPQ